MNEQEQKVSTRRLAYRWILFAATVIAVVYFIARNYEKVSRHSFDFNVWYLILSFVVVSAAYLIRFGVWTRLAALLGLKAPVRIAGRAYFLSILGRYVPGKVGLALVRVEAYSGYPPDRVVMATGMELIAALSAALLLAFTGLISSSTEFPRYLKWTALLCVVPLLIALAPPILKFVANAILKLLGRKKMEHVPPFKTNLLLVLMYTIPGFLHGLGLFLVINSLAHLSAGHYLAVTGTYYTASLAGLLAVFAPGGLGVREGVLFLVLPFLIPQETAIVAAVLIRLITIAAEICLAGLFAVAARGGSD